MRNLYEALGRQSNAISAQTIRLDRLSRGTTPGAVDLEHVKASLMILQAKVDEQISTADDALEDWRDLVPDEVEAIELEAQRGAGPATTHGDGDQTAAWDGLVDEEEVDADGTE